MALWPYIARHRAVLAAALLALLAASGATLAVPLAVRRMIDHGFTTENAGFVDSYFAMLIVVVAVLATASATRFYFVTWLGERVVADLRADVFAHLTRLDAAFFDSAKSGEIISRLAADTTQIRSAVGSSASLALRNLVLFLGATLMMIVTSPGLSAMVMAVIPVIVVPLIVFGRKVRRRSRFAQDRLADATAFAAEALGAVRTVQAFTGEARAAARYAEQVEGAFGAARSGIAQDHCR